MCYDVVMRPRLKNLLERAQDWPESDQEELVALAEEIEQRRGGVYLLDGREWVDVQEGIAQADRGEFVPDEAVAEADRRRGI